MQKTLLVAPFWSPFSANHNAKMETTEYQLQSKIDEERGRVDSRVFIKIPLLDEMLKKSRWFTCLETLSNTTS